MKRIDIRYAAGFIDGEGSFVFIGTPSIRVQNTFPGVLVLLSSRFGGQVRLAERKQQRVMRPVWEWCLYGANAIRVARELLPHLVEKKAQAEALIEAYRWPNRTASRESALRRLKELKRINYV